MEHGLEDHGWNAWLWTLYEFGLDDVAEYYPEEDSMAKWKRRVKKARAEGEIPSIENATS